MSGDRSCESDGLFSDPFTLKIPFGRVKPDVVTASYVAQSGRVGRLLIKVIKGMRATRPKAGSSNPGIERPNLLISGS